MTKGKLINAKRRALNLLDAWNDVTGVLPKHSSYYYEVQGLMEDAVECGAQAATGDHRKLDGESPCWSARCFLLSAACSSA